MSLPPRFLLPVLPELVERSAMSLQLPDPPRQALERALEQRRTCNMSATAGDTTCPAAAAGHLTSHPHLAASDQPRPLWLASKLPEFSTKHTQNRTPCNSDPHLALTTASSCTQTYLLARSWGLHAQANIATRRGQRLRDLIPALQHAGRQMRSASCLASGPHSQCIHVVSHLCQMPILAAAQDTGKGTHRCNLKRPPSALSGRSVVSPVQW